MAHCKTILSQILKFVPRHECESLAIAHHSGRSFFRASHGYQFVTKCICQLSSRNNLRYLLENMVAQQHRPYRPGRAKLSGLNFPRINEDNRTTSMRRCLANFLNGASVLRRRSKVGHVSENGSAFLNFNQAYSIGGACSSTRAWST